MIGKCNLLTSCSTRPRNTRSESKINNLARLVSVNVKWNMNIFEIGLIFSILLLNYFAIQIKGILRSKGYQVQYFIGWGSDYYKFKKLTLAETNANIQKKYKNTLNGLHFSIGLLIFVAVVGVLSQ